MNKLNKTIKPEHIKEAFNRSDVSVFAFPDTIDADILFALFLLIDK